MPTTNDVKKLKPNTMLKAQLAIDKLNRDGVRFAISETYREQAVQDAYYAQGRQSLDVINTLRKKAGLKDISAKEGMNIITHAKISKHTAGNALDVYPTNETGSIIWNATRDKFIPIAEVFKSFGFEWGGDWSEFIDLPHFEYNKG